MVGWFEAAFNNVQRHRYDQIKLEHVCEDLFIEKSPDEVGFEYEFEYSGEDSDGGERAKAVDYFSNH